MDLEIDYALSMVRKQDIKLKDFQKSVIKSYASNKDCFCVAPTGSGKSLTFVLAPFIFDHKLERLDSIALIVQPLVALMKEQVKKLRDLSIPAVYLGEDDKVTYDTIMDQKCKFIIGAPESFLHDKYTDLMKKLAKNICIIFIDESHCIKVMGRARCGEDRPFRVDYGELGRLRSLLPGVPVVTLTATATSDIRETIISEMSMTNCDFVVMDCNKINIKYSVLTVTNEIEVNFEWLVRELKSNGMKSPRVIIFCQSRQQCSDLYSFFRNRLGCDSFSVDDKLVSSEGNCLFGMYHLTTLEKQKLKIENSFKNADGVIRVLFCTSSFGMGVDVKGCSLCIHFGPPASLDEYLQQTGRIGRQGEPSQAILLKFKGCFNHLRVDKDMKTFCEATTCRRKLLMDSIGNKFVPSQINHTCCDTCSKTCTCLCQCGCVECMCDHSCQTGGASTCSAEAHIVLSNSQHRLQCQGIKSVIYIISDDQRELFRSELIDYKDSLLNQEEQQQVLTHPDFTTGFSSYLVALLVENMEHLESIETLMRDYPIFNICHAKKIMEILQKISPDLAPEHGNNGLPFNELSHSLSSDEDWSDGSLETHFKVLVHFSDNSDLEYTDFAN